MHSIEKLNNENCKCAACECLDNIIASSMESCGFDIPKAVGNNFFIAVSLVTNDEYIREQVDKLIDALDSIPYDVKDAVKQFVRIVSSSRKLFDCKVKDIFFNSNNTGLYWTNLRGAIGLGILDDLLRVALHISKTRSTIEDYEMSNMIAVALSDSLRLVQKTNIAESGYYVEVFCSDFKLVLPLGI